MSLRKEFLLLMLSVFLAFALIACAIGLLVIYPRFVTLERVEASKDVQRALEALMREIEVLAPLATDWATWDDTYQFMQDHNQPFITSNLNALSLHGLKVNFVGFYKLDGRRIWGMALDLANDEPSGARGSLLRSAAHHPPAARGACAWRTGGRPVPDRAGPDAGGGQTDRHQRRRGTVTRQCGDGTFHRCGSRAATGQSGASRSASAATRG